MSDGANLARLGHLRRGYIAQGDMLHQLLALLFGQSGQRFLDQASAIAGMLASALNAYFDDPTVTAAISLSSLVGPVRALLEGRAPPGLEANLERHLVLLLRAYLAAAIES